MDKFDIYFSGQLLKGADLEETRGRIGTLFKVSGKQLDALFSGKAVRIKAGVDVESAGRYREIFRNAGALLEIRPAAVSPEPAASQSATDDAGSEPELLPAHTGSLADCAPPPGEFHLPDLSSYGLAETGVIMDEQERPAPREFDTGTMDILSTEEGDLSDCVEKKTPLDIPDISHLDMTAPNTGSLEDCAEAKKPTPIPDISAIELADKE